MDMTQLTPNIDISSSEGETCYPVEPTFLVPERRQLRLPALGWENSMKSYLARAVARTPADLYSHVQRIYLAHTLNDGEELYGALVDLFLALGHRGLSLRKRMLTMSQNLLSEAQHTALIRYFQGGLGVTDAIPPACASMLSCGMTGISDLVQYQEQREAMQHDPLLIAQQHMECSQIDEARQELESAILADPGRVELHQELLEIYHRTRDRDRFIAMQRKLEKTENPLAEAWTKLAGLLVKDG